MSDSNKALKEKLLSSRKNGFDRVDAAELEQMEAYCKEYMAFLDAGKTERLCAAETVRLAEQAGYKPLVRGQALKAGDKVYVCNRGKSVLLAHIGSKPMSEGAQIAAAHIDSPRLDLKPNPLYEDNELAYFKTHYYGGIRKYQWVTIPMELHGVVALTDGTTVTVNIGGDEGDPKLVITDLLPHLGQEQSKKPLAEGIVVLRAIELREEGKTLDETADELMEELRELARTAGYPVVGTATQKLQSPVAATFMGSGRLLELKEYLEAVEADLIIFDEELSPAQLRNIEELCDCPVLDRTMLILDIFAARAASGEGKLQVELARLQYQLPRLAGRGVQLSRQGGGGTGGTGARRGAGESKLEVDRRHIRRRIDALKTELAALARRREQRRTRRKKDGVTTVAIVGYTNVGKSTLLNTLTQAGVLAEDKLFATLDPTARALELPDGRKVMLIDTVGLVRRLPHQLVEAFHSTLEEAASADLILSVCDITSPELLEQRAVTERLLEELGVEGTPVITVLNKCDAAPDAQNEPYKGCVRISAKTGYGLPRLLQTIAETLPPQRIRCRLCLPYAEGALLHRLEEQGQIFSREYTAEGTLLDAEVEQRDWQLYETYLRTED